MTYIKKSANWMQKADMVSDPLHNMANPKWQQKKKIKGYAERSMTQLQYVDRGKLNKCTLRINILFDTVNSWKRYFGHFSRFPISRVKYVKLQLKLLHRNHSVYRRRMTTTTATTPVLEVLSYTNIHHWKPHSDCVMKKSNKNTVQRQIREG